MVEGEPGSWPVRVVVVDDQPLLVKGLALTLHQAQGVELVAAIPSVGALDALPADVALLALGLRDGSSPRANIGALRDRGLAVLVHTELTDVYLLAEVLDAGACGIVCKHHPEEVLLEGIAQARGGGRVLPPDVAEFLEEGRARRPRLSAREVEVLNLLHAGLISKQAARRLNVSESTVKEHLKRIRQKYATLGQPVSTRVQLLQVAHRDGFIDGRAAALSDLN